MLSRSDGARTHQLQTALQSQVQLALCRQPSRVASLDANLVCAQTAAATKAVQAMAAASLADMSSDLRLAQDVNEMASAHVSSLTSDLQGWAPLVTVSSMLHLNRECWHADVSKLRSGGT